MEIISESCYLLSKWHKNNRGLPIEKYNEDLRCLSRATELTPKELESLVTKDVQYLAIQLIGEQRNIIRGSDTSVKSRVIAERVHKKLVSAFELFDITLPEW